VRLLQLGPNLGFPPQLYAATPALAAKPPARRARLAASGDVVPFASARAVGRSPTAYARDCLIDSMAAGVRL